MDNPIMARYANTADELTNRILELMKANPEVAKIDDPWALLKAGLKCDDLEPSLFQAQWSLGKAKQLYREEVTSAKS